jgi:hypothetical protein
MMDITQRIHCHKVFDAFSLIDSLERLRHELLNEPDDFHSKLSIVIVDSLGSLLGPILGPHSSGHALMMQMARVMRSIALGHNIAFLVRSQTLTFRGSVTSD